MDTVVSSICTVLYNFSKSRRYCLSDSHALILVYVLDLLKNTALSFHISRYIFLLLSNLSQNDGFCGYIEESFFYIVLQYLETHSRPEIFAVGYSAITDLLPKIKLLGHEYIVDYISSASSLIKACSSDSSCVYACGQLVSAVLLRFKDDDVFRKVIGAGFLENFSEVLHQYSFLTEGASVLVQVLSVLVSDTRCTYSEFRACSTCDLTSYVLNGILCSSGSEDFLAFGTFCKVLEVISKNEDNLCIISTPQLVSCLLTHTLSSDEEGIEWGLKLLLLVWNNLCKFHVEEIENFEDNLNRRSAILSVEAICVYLSNDEIAETAMCLLCSSQVSDFLGEKELVRVAGSVCISLKSVRAAKYLTCSVSCIASLFSVNAPYTFAEVSKHEFLSLLIPAALKHRLISSANEELCGSVCCILAGYAKFDSGVTSLIELVSGKEGCNFIVSSISFCDTSSIVIAKHIVALLSRVFLYIMSEYCSLSAMRLFDILVVHWHELEVVKGSLCLLLSYFSKQPSHATSLRSEVNLTTLSGIIVQYAAEVDSEGNQEAVVLVSDALE